MNKEFEAKKQEIIEQVRQVHNEDSRFNSANFDKAALMINELQPPKPPTCSTCAYRNAVTDDLTLGMKYTYIACTNPVMLHNLGIKFLRVDQLTIEPAKEFGCVFHSDYEVAE